MVDAIWIPVAFLAGVFLAFWAAATRPPIPRE